MKNTNFYNPKYNNITDYNLESSVYPPLIIGGLQIPAMFLLNLVVVKVIFGSAEDAFSNGLSGLALALAFSNLIGMILTVVTPVVITVASGLLLKQLNYRRPFVQAILGTALVMIAWRSIATALAGITTYIFTPVLIIICAIVYFCSYVLVSSNNNILIKLCTGFVLVLALSLSGNYTANNQSTGSSNSATVPENSTLEKGFDFDLYAPDTSYFDKVGIDTRQDDPNDNSSIMYIHAKFETPQGTIRFAEAKYDDVIENLFILSGSCDYEKLREYTGVWGKIKYEKKKEQYDTPTLLPCNVVYQSDGRTILQPNKDHQKVIGVAPFIAKIESTIIVFDAYANTTPGRYVGTTEQAKASVIDFVKNARVISGRSLGIDNE